ncbi:MAG: acyl-CoA thioesterase [Synechococcaceae bacterium WBA_2_066]|nr:acyl-CoA thioesterase [Synechococcaceae bacterium WB6_1A_059]NBP32323.1 acyl-CoA thioesterase [Synechococcaceae bacterium WB6_1B_055]NBP99568.1 acyl-CoA thioesterase [Synechococcaceae bacterium WB6_3A_227]NBQ18765.1 acyl-CoA thioesterase [Synechococcaceae bacterium WB5_2A_257]NBR44207.1 acyl-CoA thioesterase [Synechococcaceae bacterium WB5_2B_268]NBY60000.1 acyl-CoA thioesterase [Synechococcaceae bacterium LLD_019]NCU75845.1 acyl-CoA thioesterase [Synechococcaceae bacterium WB7_1C_051]NCU
MRFGDTDAAGVMHFHQLLRWCHEAYEESLERFGVSPADLFPRPGLKLELLLPIVHCSADYLAPLSCGDPLAIALVPKGLNAHSFEVSYSFSSRGEAVAVGLTRHFCLQASNRLRAPLPESIHNWLKAAAD